MEKNQSELSPFAALTYQEQQDRWLEWRSRQMDYRAVDAKSPEMPTPLQAEEPTDKEEAPSRPFSAPVFKRPAPTRHQELDEVWRRHAQAQKRAARFQPVSAGNTGSSPRSADAPDTPRS